MPLLEVLEAITCFIVMVIYLVAWVAVLFLFCVSWTMDRFWQAALMWIGTLYGAGILYWLMQYINLWVDRVESYWT